MAKEYDFRWQVDVPEALKEGAQFDRWEEETNIFEYNFTARVDEFGFFLQWISDGKEAQVMETSQISEAKPGASPKDQKILFDLQQKGTANPESIEARTFCLVSGPDFVNLAMTHYVAQDVETKLNWMNGINKIIHNIRLLHVCPMSCLKKHWSMLCLSVNERKMIPAKTIAKTFASGKNVDKILIQHFKDVGICETKNDEVDPKEFTFEKFYELYRRILKRSDIDDLFRKLSGGKDTLGATQLVTFLNEKQRDPRLNEILFPFFNENRVQQLIERYEPNTELIKKGVFGSEGFLRYLVSDENAPVFLDRIELYQDMDQPMAHYFINSSHNTYLIGRQFGGRSSTEIYRQVLLAGCRCVELDCWDGTGFDKGEPIITHGKAMCTDVLFKDVILMIKETAFVTTDYPVILSFENHCTKANQLKMARYCIDIFGDLLLTSYIEPFKLEPGIPLPSPNALRRKILIKNKRLKPEMEKTQLEIFNREGRLEDLEEEVTESAELVEGDSACDLAKKMGQGVGNGTEHNDNDDPDEASSCSDEAAEELAENELQNLRPNPRPPQLPTKGTGPTGKGEGALGGFENEAHPEHNILKAVASTGGPVENITFKNKLRNLAKRGPKEEEVEPQLSKEEEQELVDQYHYTGATTNIHPLLSSLVNYTHPVKFQGFDVSEGKCV